MSALLTRDRLAAEFKAGLSPLGHHWRLFDGDDRIGETKRAYKNPLWRGLTLTGLDSGNKISADVLDAGGETVVKLVSDSVKGKPMELTLGDGRALGRTERDDDELRMFGAGDTLVARLVLLGEDPWDLVDPAGAVVGRLTRHKVDKASPFSITDEVLGLPDLTAKTADFQRTMHLGIKHSNRYEILLDPARNDAEPLRTFAILTPVIAAYSY